MSDTTFNNVTFDMPKSQSNSIKVIGVGGGGSNAVNHMFTQDIKGVDFVICNTDAQALENSAVPNKIQLGAGLTSGLGAGANPEVGEKAARESVKEIEEMLTSQTKMVFITAGMGGGTGTGAAPIIAGVAKNMDILTVGIVTMPFQFEGRMRSKQAQKGIDELRKNVDSLIVINNNKLREVYGNLGFKAGFSKADEVLSTASRGIAEVITHHYKQNIDLHDAKTVLSNSGTAIMGSAKETGENRAQNAIMKALDSPLLNDNKITGAKNVLLLIVSGTDEVTLDEIGEISDFIQEEAGYEANIIMGVGEDEDLQDAIAVTVVATGFAIDQQREITNTEIKKVYHTLNTEQTAHYKFEDEETVVRPQMTRIIEEEPVAPKKVVHQLLEEEPDFFKPQRTSVSKDKTNNESHETSLSVEETTSEELEEVNLEGVKLEQENLAEISEDDFIINDITPDLFSAVEDETPSEVNVFDLPVNHAEEVRDTSEVADIRDILVFDAETVEPTTTKHQLEEEVIGVFDLPVAGEQEVVLETREEGLEHIEVKHEHSEERTVFLLEEDEEITDEKLSVTETKQETKLINSDEALSSPSTIKRYTLEEFDVQPTIKNSSSPNIKRNIKDIVVNDAEEIKFESKTKIVEKQVSISEEEEQVSPLNLTISELQKSAEKRKNTFKKYSHRFKNTAFNEDIIDDIEKEPAYKRLGLELHDKKDVNNISRTSIDVSDDNELTIRKNNSFLHDNVD
ncbi:cell division protein FtsZ [Wenyingzhuangia sp. IMCC45533]